MAASSSRDGTAMKTLAFITTLFLPGTFVAVSFTQGAISLLKQKQSWSDKELLRVYSA
jgi:hypothetical protein